MEAVETRPKDGGGDDDVRLNAAQEMVHDSWVCFFTGKKGKPALCLLQEHSAAHIFSVPPCSVSKGPLQLLGSGRIGIDTSMQPLSGETRKAFLLGFYPLAGTGSRTWVSLIPSRFFSEVRPSRTVNQRQDLVSTFLRVTSKCSVPRRAGCQKGTLWLPFLRCSLCERACRRSFCQRRSPVSVAL